MLKKITHVLQQTSLSTRRFLRRFLWLIWSMSWSLKNWPGNCLRSMSSTSAVPAKTNWRTKEEKKKKPEQAPGKKTSRPSHGGGNSDYTWTTTPRGLSCLAAPPTTRFFFIVLCLRVSMQWFRKMHNSLFFDALGTRGNVAWSRLFLFADLMMMTRKYTTWTDEFNYRTLCFNTVWKTSFFTCRTQGSVWIQVIQRQRDLDVRNVMFSFWSFRFLVRFQCNYNQRFQSQKHPVNCGSFHDCVLQDAVSHSVFRLQNWLLIPRPRHGTH